MSLIKIICLFTVINFSGVLGAVSISDATTPIKQTSTLLSAHLTPDKKPIYALTPKERLWLSKNPNIEIATASDWHPFIFINKQGIVDGFNVDLIAQINKNLGTNFTIKRQLSWSAGYEDLVNGDVTSLMSVTPTPEREKFLSFSPVYYYAPQYILTNQSNKNIHNIHDLENKRVSVFSNDLIAQLIKESVEVKSFHYIVSMKDAYISLSNGQVDAAVVSTLDEAQMLKHNLKIVDTVYSNAGNLAIATNKKQPMLNQIITKGIRSISKKQMKELTHSWNKANTVNTLFNIQEQEFIKKYKECKIYQNTYRNECYHN